MALDTTIAGPSADSYVTLVEANTYTVSRGLDWVGSDEDREEALRRSAVWLDAHYRRQWPGRKREERNQSLEWPRSEAYDIEGEWLDSAEIPVEIKNAQIEVAVRELASPSSLSPDVTGEKVLTGLGPMSWTITGTGSSSKRPELTVVDDILSSIVSTGSTKRLVRA